jgi:predicted acetyltransferase
LAAKVTIEPVAYADKDVLRHLMELYLYDFSEFDGRDLGPHGTYEYRYLDHYWTEPGRFPFFIRHNSDLAGLALVRFVDGSADMAEFFVMRKYRRQGVGAQAARQLFDRFQGHWDVRELSTNAPAQKFWRSVIGAYASYEENVTKDEVSQHFVSGSRNPESGLSITPKSTSSRSAS